MKPKQLLTILLLVFVAVSVGYMISKERETVVGINGEADPAMQHARLTVYYFYGDKRCPTCHKLESYANEALKTHFASELVSGEIVWKTVNVDKPANEHYIQDYKLVSKSVVLSKIMDGREVKYKNLEHIWEKVGDKNSYLQYIQNSVQMFLEEE
jgi:hypothetical protein